MALHALVHTQGVVLGKQYIPLELGYIDVTGYEIHFQITSPLSYSKAKRFYKSFIPDAIMTTRQGQPYSDVLRFLRERYHELSRLYKTPEIYFGYKGRSYQPTVLRDAGLERVINVDTLGLPALRHLATSYNVGQFTCPFHNQSFKCARLAVRLIWYALQQNRVSTLCQQEPFREIPDGGFRRDGGSIHDGVPQMISIAQRQ